MERIHNPFQSFDVSIPIEFHDDVVRFTLKDGGSTPDQSPFTRMIDIWFLAMMVAVREGLKPVSMSGMKTIKIIDGTIFSSDPWRIWLLQMVAITYIDDVSIVCEPKQIMNLASDLAVAGFPRVFDMLKQGSGDPIWNLSDAVQAMIESELPMESFPEK